MVCQAALAWKQPLRAEAMEDEPTEHLTTTEARGASTPHMTRYVLGIGLVLIIVIFAFIFLIRW
jgi:hypothetical protein